MAAIRSKRAQVQHSYLKMGRGNSLAHPKRPCRRLSGIAVAASVWLLVRAAVEQRKYAITRDCKAVEQADSVEPAVDQQAACLGVAADPNARIDSVPRADLQRIHNKVRSPKRRRRRLATMPARRARKGLGAGGSVFRRFRPSSPIGGACWQRRRGQSGAFGRLAQPADRVE